MIRACPLCRNDDAISLERVGSLTLHKCRACSMVYAPAAAEGNGLAVHIQREYFGEAYLRKRGFLGDRFHRRKAQRRLRVIRRYKPGGRLLDIGFGGGDLLLEAREAGYEVVGLDCSATLVAHARQRHGLQVHCGDPAGFEPAKPFDVVVMSHVVEHVLDPLRMLRAVRRLVAPAGILYMATPNVACWEARLAGWASYEPYHFAYFSPSTLRRALDQAGYRVLDVRTWEPLSGWLNTVVRGCLGDGYSTARLAIQRDPRGIRRPRYLVVRAGLGGVRVASGLLLTPVRWLQAALLCGEELICVATPGRVGESGDRSEAPAIECPSAGRKTPFLGLAGGSRPRSA